MLHACAYKFSFSAYDDSLQACDQMQNTGMNPCARVGWFRSDLVNPSSLLLLLVLPLLQVMLLPPIRLRPGCLRALARCTVLGPVCNSSKPHLRHVPQLSPEIYWSLLEQ